MKRIGIVTGASSGIGRAYAIQIDKKYELDEIWLIARRRERLEALAEKLQTPARILPLDLTDPNAALEIQDLLRTRDVEISAGKADRSTEKHGSAGKTGSPNKANSAGETGFADKIQVLLLINAAGFGKFEKAQDMTLQENHDMIDLNCRALVDMTSVCLPYMGKGSRIIQVASCAGFQPLQGLNLYAATKSFVINYTRALRWEVGGYGIKATAVCPWWVKTEFNQVAGETGSPGTVKHITAFCAHKPETIASWSLGVNAIGLPVATCGPISFAMRIAGKIIPNPLIMGIWAILRRI